LAQELCVLTVSKDDSITSMASSATARLDWNGWQLLRPSASSNIMVIHIPNFKLPARSVTGGSGDIQSATAGRRVFPE